MPRIRLPQLPQLPARRVLPKLPRIRLPKLPQLPARRVLAKLPRIPGIRSLLKSLGEWYAWRRSLEYIVVYDDDRQLIWRAELPRSEILANFDRRARYVRPDWKPEIVGVLFMLSVGWLVGFALFYLWIPAPVFDLIMGAGPAFVVGASGWWIGPLFGPRAHWMARRKGGALFPILHGVVESVVTEVPESNRPADPDYTPERGAKFQVEYQKIPMKGVEVLTSDVMFEIMEMRDERALVTGGMSRWQKIALGGVFSLLTAMVVALFFFGAVFSQQGG